jgi:ATP-dependent DNA helicase RecQ
LWEALRAWRLGEARRQEVPPYVIFHDSTLIEVARRRPASLAALAEIPGIGRSKRERYGCAVIAVVAADIASGPTHSLGEETARPSAPDTDKESLS